MNGMLALKRHLARPACVGLSWVDGTSGPEARAVISCDSATQYGEYPMMVSRLIGFKEHQYSFQGI
ncbi:hypothetical protein INR49_018074 [Caranx melampygus]|nr:hypothetical protein INR49_018074 [Caranx melampygus]